MIVEGKGTDVQICKDCLRPKVQVNGEWICPHHQKAMHLLEAIRISKAQYQAVMGKPPQVLRVRPSDWAEWAHDPTVRHYIEPDHDLMMVKLKGLLVQLSPHLPREYEYQVCRVGDPLPT